MKTEIDEILGYFAALPNGESVELEQSNGDVYCVSAIRFKALEPYIRDGTSRQRA